MLKGGVLGKPAKASRDDSDLGDNALPPTASRHAIADENTGLVL